MRRHSASALNTRDAASSLKSAGQNPVSAKPIDANAGKEQNSGS
jgi:hypothetical protein